MRYRSRRGQSVSEPLWRRIDRAAREVNPFLLVLAIGLVILYLTCLAGLLIKLPVMRVSTCAAGPSPAIESVAQHPLPNVDAITSRH
jgi:hypothetical protein